MRKPRNEPLADPSSPLPSAGRAGGELVGAPSDGDEPSPDLSRQRERDDPQRTCILSRRTADKAALIRLVLGPDGQVHPDVRAKAPGRGAWIGVTRAELETALAKGKLKGALARAFRTQAMEIAPDLPERIEQALSRAALDRLGMEARSGTLINGADRVEQAARMGKVRLLLHAADAGSDGRRKLDQAWRVGGSEEIGHRHGLEIPASRTILSMALGRENVVHAALTDQGAAARVLAALTRWRAFIVGPAGLGRGDDAVGHGTADDE
ncbi:DUF448 domain-containing protein [Sphingomonas sp. LHG3406-1]|uniref:DUF448 domain-containing protein n=1 Tax=Sphingomonas sp. LHG3406-1 TaxID=2804617 RepID=UPI0026090E87|nr:DUF448 domain-containing protein [Sphingomonas sp. LHG3406-1]